MSKKAAIDRAIEFYGAKVCVVTGADSGVDWHHLDENSSHWTFANIIPLVASFNSAIELHRRDMSNLLPSGLFRNGLLEVAQRHYERGLFPDAYACYRLAGFLASNHDKSGEAAIICSAHALRCLRPMGETHLTLDIIRRSIIPQLLRDHRHPDIRAATKALLALEISAFYSDAAIVTMAKRWERAVVALVASLPRGATTPDFESRLLHHIGITELGSGHVVASIALSREAVSIQQDLYRFTKTTSGLWSARGELARNNVDAAAESLEVGAAQSEELRPVTNIRLGRRLKGFGWWTLAEALGTKADVLSEMDRRDDADEWARSSYECFRQTKVRPVSVHESSALRNWERRFLHQRLWLRRRSEQELSRLARAFDAVHELLTRGLQGRKRRRGMDGICRLDR